MSTFDGNLKELKIQFENVKRLFLVPYFESFVEELYGGYLRNCSYLSEITINQLLKEFAFYGIKEKNIFQLEGATVTDKAVLVYCLCHNWILKTYSKLYQPHINDEDGAPYSQHPMHLKCVELLNSATATFFKKKFDKAFRRRDSHGLLFRSADRSAMTTPECRMSWS